MMRSTRSRLAARTLTPLAAVAVAGTLLAGGALGQLSGPVTGSDTSTSVPGIRPAGSHARFDTVFASPVGIEGLTGDGHGFLYSAGRGEQSCPVWRVPVRGGQPTVVGRIAAPCRPSGLTFDAHGRLYIADGDRVDMLTPDSQHPPIATVFTSGVPGANGLAFDRQGSLWVSDGTAGQGRVWRVGRDRVPVEKFRIQPMANDVNVVDGVGGVGRDNRSLPPGTVNFIPNRPRSAANTAGSQSLVANGLAFSRNGRTLFVADTARGAIWRVELGRHGEVRSPVGCDATFPADTLCLDDVFVAHPYLEGSDGIVLDRAGNIFSAANERNAIVVVSRTGRVREFFRDPPAASRLRNDGPLEFPTSPFISGHTLCVTQSDGNRRDNSPNSAGEVGPGGPAVAKISCLRQPLPVAGLPLPVG